MPIYDYIIIGGGIAGLTIYHRLQNHNKNLKILLLEKNDYIGGRMKQQDFHGTTIKLGSGIIDETCVHMKALLKSLRIEPKQFKSNLVDIYLPTFNINDAIDKIIKIYDQETQNKKVRLDTSVNTFLQKHFDNKFIELFYMYADYSDFHCQDINDFIISYPITDMIREEQNIWSFKISDVMEQLKKGKNIVLNYEVKNIKVESDQSKKVFTINNELQTYNIITATTINCLKQLLNYPFLSQIQSTPFYRNFIYSKNLSKFPSGVVMAKNELKKMIKLSDDVLMVVYCDTDDARFWHYINKIEESKPGFRVKVIKKLLKENDSNLSNIEILDQAHHYWNEGIHYYLPNVEDRKKWIIENMHPEEGVYICGEMLSIKQGWMEGAVQSADMLFENYFQ